MGHMFAQPSAGQGGGQLHGFRSEIESCVDPAQRVRLTVKNAKGDVHADDDE
jgi:hypothetical protein